MTASRRKSGKQKNIRAKRDKAAPDYRRHRVMARSIAGRILVRDDGRMLVLGGDVSFSKLVKWMKQLRATRGPGNDVLSEGFPFVIEGELTEYALKVRGLALHRWRTGLEIELKQRRLPRRRAKELKAELREVDTLQLRLERLFDWHRRVLRDDLPSGHPFFLDEDSTELLKEKLATLSPVFNDAVHWQACTVLWWSGGAAMNRFLEALGRFPQSHDDADDLVALRTLGERFAVFGKRSRTERQKQIVGELREMLDAIPENLRSDAQLGWRARGQTLAEHCQLMRKRCEEEIKTRQTAHFRRAPAILAALCVHDGSLLPLPDRLVRDASTDRTTTGCEAIAEAMAELSGEPGYDLLLRHMDDIAPASMTTVQKLLHEGESVEDLDWAAKRELICAEWHGGLKPGWARRFFTLL
nr:hypothetical protein [Planctomycetota bacterium]